MKIKNQILRFCNTRRNQSADFVIRDFYLGSRKTEAMKQKYVNIGIILVWHFHLNIFNIFFMLNNIWWITKNFLEFKGLISDCNIKCNWKEFSKLIFYFRPCQLQVMCLKRLFRLYSEKWNTAYCAIFKL